MLKGNKLQTPEQLRAAYGESPKYLRALIAGEKGSGKTSLLATCPKPVYLMGFDPGGEQVLLERDKEGVARIPDWLIPDIGYQSNDADAFEAWVDTLTARAKEDTFNNGGTLALDSLTTWVDSLQAYLTRKLGKPYYELANPRAFWAEFLYYVRVYLKAMLTANCHVVVLAHVQNQSDDLTGRVIRSIMMPGQSAGMVPTWFSEFWVLRTVAAKGGETKYDPASPAKQRDIQRYLLTGNDGMWQTGTRIGKDGIFDLHEKPDIEYLLNKAGML